MRFSTLLNVTGIIGVVFGVLFFVVPVTAMAQYGATTDATGLFMARYFGSALVYLGLIYLALARIELPSVRGVALAACVGELGGLWVSLRLQMSGAVNSLGWTSVALYALLALAFARYALRPSSI
jgi:hypothetical protein